MTNAKPIVEAGKTPFGIWWSLVAGFAAWGFDLGLSYLLEQHSCSTGHSYVLHTISFVCFVAALSGFATGFMEKRRFPHDSKEEGGSSLDRAHFQALIGMIFSLSFAVVIVAGAIPRWILHPCQ
jgi:hypothetical protein